MLTRCPHCATAFRVTPEQLKVRNGLARCGSCHGVFNALDSLTDEVALVIGQNLAPLAAPRQVQTDPLAEPEIRSEAEIDSAPEIEAEPEALLPEKFQEAADQTPAANPSSSAEGEVAPDAVPIAEADIGDVSVTPEVDFAILPEEPAANGDQGNKGESRRPQDGAALIEAESIKAEPSPVDEVVPVATAEPEEEDFPEAWSAVPAPPPPPRRWPWVTGVFLLLALTVGQLLFVFRIELGVLLPELRPALVAACDLLGCVLAHPRKPEMLSIETSDLAPGDGDRLLFTATLKNRAPFDQEYPHLELTLTDTRDAAMVRKVLAPADYLSPSQSIKAGFSARSELAVKLTLEALGVPAVGYRLYLFYP
jgi:predicted Zn finger-like uncharacterized protein